MLENTLYILRKLLPSLAMPLGVSLMLLAAGIVLRRRGVALAGFVVLTVSSMPIMSDALFRVLEEQYPRISAAGCPAADAILVLGGIASELEKYPGETEWAESVDRFESGVTLFRLRKAPVLLFPAGKTPTDTREIVEGDTLRRAAIDHGVPAAAIRLTDKVSNTAEEAIAVRKYLRETGGHRIILVTSSYHMPRAAFLFRRAGVEITPFPVDIHADTWHWSFESLIPNPGALSGTERVVREIYGNVLYRTKAALAP